MSREVERYELPITVRPEDIDLLGHVNNIVYLRWVQDAAVAHWRAVADPRDQDALFWVIVRHEIDYKRPALLADAILAVTWVGATVGRNFERFTEIRRTADAKVLAQARTLWCPMDRVTGRPTEVNDTVRARFSTPARGDGSPTSENAPT